jgi:hypothetical protein
MLYPPLFRTAYQLLGPDLKGILVSLLNFYFWKGNGYSFMPFTDFLLQVFRSLTYLLTYCIWQSLS